MMIKKAYIFHLLFCLTFSRAVAQVPYTTLDSLSTLVSQFQNTNEGKIFYTNDGSQFELSFSKNNFYVLSHNRMAGYSEYRKKDNTERLYITENIDLSKAIAIELAGSNGQCINLMFPAGHLKTQVYENGKLIETQSPVHLQFYLLNYGSVGSEEIYGERFKTLAFLCHLMQIEKGLMTEAGRIQENKEFNDLLDEKAEMNLRIIRYETFIKKYPQSIYLQEVVNTHRSVKEFWDETNPTSNYINALCDKYKFKPDLSFSKFIEFNIDARNHLTNKIVTGDEIFYGRTSPQIVPGSFSMGIKENKVHTYNYIIESATSNKSTVVKKMYDEHVAEIKKAIPEKYYSEVKKQYFEMISVSHPKLKTQITIINRLYTPVNGQFLQISFSTLK